MKQVFFFLFLFFLFPVLLFAQQPDSVIAKKDSGVVNPSSRFKKDSLPVVKKGLPLVFKEDSSSGTENDSSFVKHTDSAVTRPDSVALIKKDTVVNRSATYYITIQKY